VSADDDLDLSQPPHAAGGLGALVATVKHLRRDSGIARGLKALLAMNQEGGFDCPGCAWPEPTSGERARFEFCENGAKALAEEATTARADPELFSRATVDELRELSDFELGRLGRLTQPLILGDDRKYHAIDWDRAIALVAAELTKAGPDASAFYTSGRTSNEAAFLYQLLGRMFGTNNFPDCSNMCHESSGNALIEVVGVDKGTVSLSDFDHCDLIFVIGQNPGTNHPRMLTTLREAAKRGCTIISVNPLREVGLSRFSHPQHPLDLLAGGVALASEFVQVQIGGDQAFFLGVGKAVLELDAAAAVESETAVKTVKTDSTVTPDLMFLADKTDNFFAWRDHALATPWSAIVESAGVDEDTIRRIAEKYAKAKAVIACWAMGITQHKHAVRTIHEIVNVMLLRGNIGRPGAGLLPVRGHSNVQGDRTMGIDHHLRHPFLDRLGAAFGFEPPRIAGYDTVGTIAAMERRQLRAFVMLGGNWVSATPDTHRTARVLEACDLTVSISTKVNRTHLYPGKTALILPCLARSEVDSDQFVTVEDSMSMVHRSQGTLRPASPDLRSEPAIIAALGEVLVGSERVAWRDYAANYDRIRDKISQVVLGCWSYNERVRQPDGFQLPNTARDGSFTNVGGRARFTVSPLPDLALPPGRLRLMTMRSHDQYNTTIYGLDDRYRGVRGERRVVFVNPADMVELGLHERQLVDLISEWHDGERLAEAFIVVPYDLPRRNCASYFPEANPLVPLDSYADRSNTPTSKSITIRIRPRA
jgi:molybdopterin-dependent oxidoreductase alpha subunit